MCCFYCAIVNKGFCSRTEKQKILPQHHLQFINRDLKMENFWLCLVFVVAKDRLTKGLFFDLGWFYVTLCNYCIYAVPVQNRVKYTNRVQRG